MTRPRPFPTLLRPRDAAFILSAALVWALLSGCALFNRDATATWELDPDQTVTTDTVTFTALVTRLGCNSGVTGTVNDPDIEVTDTAVVITFTVSPGEPSAASCQGNDAVSYEVELPEALGDRQLVDGACDSTEANGTGPCDPDGVRRSV